MATSGYKTGHNEHGILNGQKPVSECESDERHSGDVEEGTSRAVGHKGPFGDEKNADVKYQTMAWWYEILNLQNGARKILTSIL